MKCPKDHEHDKLSCPTCAEQKGRAIPGERMIAAIKNGAEPIRFDGHLTLHPDSWRKIAKEFNISLSDSKFPTLCGKAEYPARKLRRGEMDRIDNCPECGKRLEELHSEMYA